MSFKKGQKVKYTARVKSGAGVIKAVRETRSGAFYDVEDGSTKKTISVRAAQLSAA